MKNNKTIKAIIKNKTFTNKTFANKTFTNKTFKNKTFTNKNSTQKKTNVSNIKKQKTHKELNSTKPFNHSSNNNVKTTSANATKIIEMKPVTNKTNIIKNKNKTELDKNKVKKNQTITTTVSEKPKKPNKEMIEANKPEDSINSLDNNSFDETQPHKPFTKLIDSPYKSLEIFKNGVHLENSAGSSKSASLTDLYDSNHEEKKFINEEAESSHVIDPNKDNHININLNIVRTKTKKEDLENPTTNKQLKNTIVSDDTNENNNESSKLEKDLLLNNNSKHELPAMIENRNATQIGLIPKISRKQNLKITENEVIFDETIIFGGSN